MRFILGVLIGIAAGALVGAVVAPRSTGAREALQHRFAHAAEDGKEAIEATVIRRSED